jgi:RHS repeat-associated protein
MGRLIGTTTQYSFLPGITYSNAYGYDAASNRTSFTAPDGSTNMYAYDTLGRLSTLTNSLTGQFGFSYDSLSRRTALNRPNGVNTSYGYDSLSRLLNVLHKAGTVTLDGAGYTYDNAGNRTAKTNYLNNITEQYTYDPTYQLTQVAQGTTTTESYSYDAVGNRLSSLGMSPYVYNSSNELTSTPAATFTYDNNGNTLTKVDSSGTTTYNWDFENRLASVVVPGTGGTVTFKYDPFGRRIQKGSPDGTTTYLYDGDNSIAETDAAGNLMNQYTQDPGIDEPVAISRSGAIRYVEQDGLASITSVTDATNALVNTYIYNSFGTLTASIGTFANPYRYTGQHSDDETELYYYRARYYDGITGRFISEDPMRFLREPNSYRYASNNPINLRDPSGLCPDKELAKYKDCVREKYKEIEIQVRINHNIPSKPDMPPFTWEGDIPYIPGPEAFPPESPETDIMLETYLETWEECTKLHPLAVLSNGYWLGGAPPNPIAVVAPYTWKDRLKDLLPFFVQPSGPMMSPYFGRKK